MRHSNEFLVTLQIMQLFSQHYPTLVVGEAGHSESPLGPIVIIPGLFGSTSNWRGFARRIEDRHPVIVVDQRNHGRSPHADSQSYFDMADDLLRLLDDQGLDKAVLCGHSMGGKTAMTFALLNPERVSRLVVLDIAPVRYSHSHVDHLDALMGLDLSVLKSRGEADRALQAEIPEASTRLFLLQSLSGSPGSYYWRLNLPVLRKFMPDIVAFPDSELAGKFADITTAVIYGESSDYVKAEHREAFGQYFGNVSFRGIAQAGHWLHVDQPQSVVEAVLEFVQQGEKND